MAPTTGTPNRLRPPQRLDNHIGTPPGGTHPPSRYNAHDAIYAAAAYLCDSGARDRRDLHAATIAYNHGECDAAKRSFRLPTAAAPAVGGLANTRPARRKATVVRRQCLQQTDIEAQLGEAPGGTRLVWIVAGYWRGQLSCRLTTRRQCDGVGASHDFYSMQMPRRRSHIQLANRFRQPQAHMRLRLPQQRRVSRPRSRGIPVAVITQTATALAALGALVFTGMSLNVTQSQNAAQNDLAAQSQYTDRYTKAVDQLGQQGLDRLQIRLGGIYALERLASDSPRDQPTIIEVLSAFVRTNSPVEKDGKNPCPFSEFLWSSLPPSDVQAALTVLGRRNPTHDNKTRIDLSRTCLNFADLSSADLAGADLDYSDLVGADLTGANLTRADLSSSNLKSARLDAAHLAEAHLVSANLTGAGLTGVDLTSAGLLDANLSWAHATRAHIADADLTKADLSHSDLVGVDLTDANLLGAGLFVANLTGANLTGANLTRADLNSSNLSSANLSNATHDSTTHVDRVVSNSLTRGKWW
jgi:uncharacterized protein YjbI with pentapeptide repeats